MLEHHRVQEVIIADPDFPEERAVELVDQCHRRGVTVRIAPSTMEILVHRAEFVPGASVPLFELRPPVFDGFDYFVKRTFDFVGALLLLLAAQPAAAGDRDRRLRDLARPGALPLAPAGDRRRAVRLLQVPHDALRRRPAAGRPRVAQRGLGPAVQDPPRPAHDARRPAPAALLARRAAAAVQRRARPDVARRPAAAAAARLRAARGVAQEALPRAARPDRPVAGLRAAPSSTSTISSGSTSSTSSAGRSGSTSRSSSRNASSCSLDARNAACMRARAPGPASAPAASVSSRHQAASAWNSGSAYIAIHAA